MVSSLDLLFLRVVLCRCDREDFVLVLGEVDAVAVLQPVETFFGHPFVPGVASAFGRPDCAGNLGYPRSILVVENEGDVLVAVLAVGV